MTPEPLSATEIFDRDCPYFLAIGMTYDQYWYDDPMLVRAFAKADKIKRERKDFYLWLQGRYFADAIASTIGNAFRDKGTEPCKYPAKPYLMEETEQQKAEKEEQEIAFADAWMNQLCEVGKNWGKDKGQGEADSPVVDNENN